MQAIEEKQERAVIVGLKRKKESRDFASSMRELEGLVKAAGAQVVAELVQVREKPENATYIGTGKIQELAHLIVEKEAQIVVFDQELSPVQLRNLESLLESKVIDRSMLILDIFSQRARSREGKLQVELALLQYHLPRLSGQGKDLSRLGAGIGTRGAGEQKLELDRRRIRRRIQDIKRQLEKVKITRQTQRKQRERQALCSVSLVGYTNAGKSSLFNYLCARFTPAGNAPVEADSRLFQTLDTTTRSLRLPGGDTCLLSDSVGFIQNLPHHLVAAFRSTLEEAVMSDWLLLVVDASHAEHLEQLEVVRNVLQDLNVPQEKIILVYNKVDLLDIYPAQGLYISAHTGQGMERLLSVLQEKISENHRKGEEKE